MVDAAYDELMDIHKEISDSLDRLEAQLLPSDTADTDAFCIVNTCGFDLDGEIEIPCPDGHAVFTAAGERLPILSRKVGAVTVTVSVPAFSCIDCRIDKFEENKNFHKFAYAQRRGVAAVLRNDVTEEKGGESGEVFTVENDFYIITATTHGIIRILDKETGAVVAEEGEYKVGEWILEHDEGSPWATLSTDMRRMPLSDVTFLVSFEQTDDYQRLTYSHTKKYWGYAVDAGYEIFYSVTLPRGEKKIRFTADVDWDTQNHRLRIAFPTPLSGKSIYEIPYGYIERKPYEKNIVWPHGPSNWAGAAGDCPAIGFAGVWGEGASLAILNRGTPSYSIEPDKNGRQTVFLSVLRSPTVGTYLHEPESYTMTDYYEMRDAGKHHFEYCLTSYGEGFDKNRAVSDAASYNSALFVAKEGFTLPEMPRVHSDGVKIRAVKPACDGNGFILRLYEYHGSCARVSVTVPPYVKAVYETDLKEDTVKELPVTDGTVTLEFDPFKIKTLRFVI